MYVNIWSNTTLHSMLHAVLYCKKAVYHLQLENAAFHLSCELKILAEQLKTKS